MIEQFHRTDTQDHIQKLCHQQYNHKNNMKTNVMIRMSYQKYPYLKYYLHSRVQELRGVQRFI